MPLSQWETLAFIGTGGSLCFSLGPSFPIYKWRLKSLCLRGINQTHITQT